MDLKLTTQSLEVDVGFQLSRLQFWSQIIILLDLSDGKMADAHIHALDYAGESPVDVAFFHCFAAPILISVVGVKWNH